MRSLFKQMLLHFMRDFIEDLKQGKSYWPYDILALIKFLVNVFI